MGEFFLQYFSTFYFSKNRKTGYFALCAYLRNEIKILFFYICEIIEQVHSSAGPLKTYIFYGNRFLYFLQKKSSNKLRLIPHDTYCLLRMFFSQVNNKQNKISWAIPLKYNNYDSGEIGWRRPNYRVSRFYTFTEGIASILSMHLAVCRFLRNQLH